MNFSVEKKITKSFPSRSVMYGWCARHPGGNLTMKTFLGDYMTWTSISARERKKARREKLRHNIKGQRDA